MALTFEVGNQWPGRARFPAGIFTARQEACRNFSHSGEKAGSQHVVCSPQTFKSSFLSRFTWPGLLPCPGEQLSCGREAKRYFEGGKIFLELEMSAEKTSLGDFSWSPWTQSWTQVTLRENCRHRGWFLENFSSAAASPGMQSKCPQTGTRTDFLRQKAEPLILFFDTLQ